MCAVVGWCLLYQYQERGLIKLCWKSVAIEADLLAKGMKVIYWRWMVAQGAVLLSG